MSALPCIYINIDLNLIIWAKFYTSINVYVNINLCVYITYNTYITI